MHCFLVDPGDWHFQTLGGGQNQITAYSYNGLPAIDGSHYACSDAGVNSAITALPSTGGTVDARRCLGTSTLASETDVGTNSESVFHGVLQTA